MSDETTSTQTDNQSTQTLDAAPEKAMAFTKPMNRPKKLGLSSATAGENELTGISKKSDNPINRRRQKEDAKTSFDPPPKEEKVATFDKKEAPKGDVKEPPKAPQMSAEQKSEQKAQEEIKEAIRKFKVKIDGQELEVDEEELKRGYQIRKASDKAFQEAAAIRKRNEEWIQKMKSKDTLGEVLSALGHNPRQLAEEVLTEAINFELMTPEQKEIAKLRYEKQQRDMEIKRAIEAQNATKAEQESKVATDRMQQSIIKALEVNTDLPKDTGTVRRIIEAMRVRIKAQELLPPDLREDVTPESVLEDVKGGIANEMRAKLAGMTPEQLSKFIPKEILDNYRKWELGQIKNPVSAVREPVLPAEIKREPKRHYKTMEEWFANQRAAGSKRF